MTQVATENAGSVVVISLRNEETDLTRAFSVTKREAKEIQGKLNEFFAADEDDNSRMTATDAVIQ